MDEKNGEVHMMVLSKEMEKSIICLRNLTQAMIFGWAVGER